MNRRWGLGFVAALCLLSGALAQDRATKVRNDRARVEGSGFWIYNDLTKGLAHGCAAELAGWAVGVGRPFAVYRPDP